ncbi:MAG TPA: site-2 protease family protein [Acidimicrobiales bacterium]|nr:site-2 protease family protein [Acidimicrobiales bacterium]
MTDTHAPPPPGPPVPAPPERRPDPAPAGSSPLRLAALAGAVVALGLVAGLSAVIVVLAIVVMIFLHELGHYVTAKAAGMKVTEFFIGFGPRIWSTTRGETEYGVKAIPAGAYVRIIGMNNLDEVDPADEDRTYRQKSYWRRMSVAVAGSTMHFLIAIACLFTLFVGFGVTDDARWEVGRLATFDDTQESPAGAAGVEVGDEITAVAGTPVTTFDDLRDAVGGSDPGDTVSVAVVRDGVPVTIDVTLGETPTGGAFLGIGPEYPTERLDPFTAAGRSITEFGRFTWESTAALGRFFTPGGLSDFVGQAVDRGGDDVTAPGGGTGEGVEGENRVLSIYGAARIGAQATDSGMAGLLGFLVLINIFIGVFNLVPLLPLDGGHVAVGTYEKIREVLSRSSVRYHADVAKLLPLTYLVVAVLVSIGLLALYLDISDPVDLPQ